MRVTYDPAKRLRTLEERGLDFERAVDIFGGLTLEVEDDRHDYGEKRILCVGFLEDRMVWWAIRLARPHATYFRWGDAMKGKSVGTRRTSSRASKKLPELSDEMLSRAVLKRAGKRVGRPKSENPKVAISIRLPPEVLKRWRATGDGWQTRMAEVLSKRAP